MAAGTKRICRSEEKIRAVVAARPEVGRVIQSEAVEAEGEDVLEICQTPWVAMEVLPVMAM